MILPILVPEPVHTALLDFHSVDTASLHIDRSGNINTNCLITSTLSKLRLLSPAYFILITYHRCRVGANTVWSHMAGDTRSSRTSSRRELYSALAFNCYHVTYSKYMSHNKKLHNVYMYHLTWYWIFTNLPVSHFATKFTFHFNYLIHLLFKLMYGSSPGNERGNR